MESGTNRLNFIQLRVELKGKSPGKQIPEGCQRVGKQRTATPEHPASRFLGVGVRDESSMP